MDDHYDYYSHHCVGYSVSPLSTSTSFEKPKLTNPSTSTPPVVTVTRALLDFAALQTLIGNIVEPTITHWQVARTTTTKSVPWTVTITQTTTPSAWAAECTSGGGKVW
jgi:hypothetical protein